MISFGCHCVLTPITCRAGDSEGPSIAEEPILQDWDMCSSQVRPHLRYNSLECGLRSLLVKLTKAFVQEDDPRTPDRAEDGSSDLCAAAVGACGADTALLPGDRRKRGPCTPTVAACAGGDGSWRAPAAGSSAVAHRTRAQAPLPAEVTVDQLEALLDFGEEDRQAREDLEWEHFLEVSPRPCPRGHRLVDFPLRKPGGRDAARGLLEWSGSEAAAVGTGALGTLGHFALDEPLWNAYVLVCSCGRGRLV